MQHISQEDRYFLRHISDEKINYKYNTFIHACRRLRRTVYILFLTILKELRYNMINFLKNIFRRKPYKPICPNTLEKSVDALMCVLTDSEKLFLSVDPDAALILHHTRGRWIRNEFGLWLDESPLRDWFKEHYAVDHPDDISGMILEAVQARIRGNQYDAQARAESIVKFYEKYDERMVLLTREFFNGK